MTGTDTSGPLFNDERYQRLMGIARTVLWELSKDDREDIIQNTVVKLEDLYATLLELRVAWVRTVLRRMAIDNLRSARKFVPASLLISKDADESGLPEDIEQTLSWLAKPEAEDPDEPEPPLCVLEERLKLCYGQGHFQPYELLVHAYWSRLHWQPAQIVESLGGRTLAEAAEGFITRYSADSRIPKTHLKTVFSDIFAISAGPDADTLLSACWDVEDVLQSWVSTVAGKIPASNPYDFTAAVQQSPNKRLVYLLRDRMGLDFHQIITHHGGDTLDRIALSFQGDYALRHDLGPRRVRDLFTGMLDCGKVGKRLLNEYYSPARFCTRWCDAVNKHLRSRVHQQDKIALAKIFAAAPSYKTMSFIEGLAFQISADGLLRERGGQTMRVCAENLAERYAKKWEFDLELVRGWFEPLLEQAALTDDRTLLDLVRREQGAGEIGPSVISRWRTEVLELVKNLFGCNRPDTLHFAWRVGLIESVNSQSARYSRGAVL